MVEEQEVGQELVGKADQRVSVDSFPLFARLLSEAPRFLVDKPHQLHHIFFGFIFYYGWATSEDFLALIVSEASHRLMKIFSKVITCGWNLRVFLVNLVRKWCYFFISRHRLFALRLSLLIKGLDDGVTFGGISFALVIRDKALKVVLLGSSERPCVLENMRVSMCFEASSDFSGTLHLEEE